MLASSYPRWKDDPEPAFVHELCRRLTTTFEVTALVPDAPAADPDGLFDGVNVIRYRYAPRRWQLLVNDGGIVNNLRRHRWKWLLVPPFVLLQYLAARKLVRRIRPDVIHAHWLIPQGEIARRLHRRFGVPYLVTSHGGDLFGLNGSFALAIKRRVARSAAAMTVVSHAMREECERLQLCAAPPSVVPMGVDLKTRFVPSSGVARVPDQLLFVGRLVPKKGLGLLLAALPRVAERRPAVTLLIAGFGPLREDLERQVLELGLGNRVRFLGAVAQSDLPDLYRRAAVFTAPFIRDETGDQEGLPVALMEAVGCGCPAVVGDVPGLRDLLGDSSTAMLVGPRDAAALSDAIVAALEQPDVAQARAANVRAAAMSRVDWDTVAGEYARILLETMKPSGTWGKKWRNSPS